MVLKNNTIFNEYVDLHNKYKKLYGEKTLILMEVGMFYEIYSLNNGKVGPNLDTICSILNIIYTKKNKSINEVSQKNPYMAGVPINSIDKYIDNLVKNNYTIVLVNQYDDEMGSKSKKIRKVDEIISPSTYMNQIASYKSNFLMMIYLYKYKNRKTAETIISVSISIIELSIGKVYLLDIHNKDDKLLFDNIYRIILKYNPSEIVVFGDDFDFTNIRNNLNLDNMCMHNQIDNYEKKILDINYQKEIIRKIYKNTGILDPIEYIGLEKNPELLVSFINLINFTYLHNEKIIQNINIPIILNNDDKLILGYNLVKKLDIISNDDNKYSCLLNILNNSVTHIGKRFFSESLLNPLTNTDEINKKYNEIELMLKEKRYEIVRNELKNICDLERFFRKIYLNKLCPFEFFSIYSSINIIISIFDKFIQYSSSYMDFFKYIDIEKENSKLILNKFLNYIDDNLNINKVDGINFENINAYIFKENENNKQVYELQRNLEDNINYFTNLANELNNINRDFNNFFKVDYNDTLGYFLQITQNRFNIFKRNSKYDKIDELITKKVSASSTTLRVTKSDFNIINQDIISLKNNIKNICQETYITFCNQFYSTYNKLFDSIVKTIKILDYSSTNAYNSKLYKYTRPNIKKNDNGFLDISQLRHPIIEIINEDIKYITNDISLGIDKKGILLYGMNSSGKSSLMKSLGLITIMAQAGMYVPCKKMNYYPYKKIYCRIPGGDNIFKGQSTFVAEISEIRNILKSSDSSTLVIGDELCSGTETESAISIVTSGIINLINKNTSFIFATHLHELASLERIKSIKNLSINHLSVNYDNEKNILIFDRKIREGSGESIYGLEVCKSLDLDKDFIELAYTIRKENLGNLNLIKYKKSKYNSNLILDKCNICKTNDATETHHIRFQKDADEDGFIDNFHKNKKFNLIGLCDNCHDRIHNGELEIGEATMTSNGIMYT